MSTTTIVTATYNKAGYLWEAAESVLAQTHSDWRWWLILNNADAVTTLNAYIFQERDPRITVFQENFPEQLRFTRYWPAVFANKYYPMITTAYIAWLSDDDILYPNFLETLMGYLNTHPDHHCVYGTLDIGTYDLADRVLHRQGQIVADKIYGGVDGPNPSCHVDGGQVLHTKKAWDGLGDWRIPELMPTASVCDGIFLERLTAQHPLYPVDVPVALKRKTPLSEHQKC